MQSDQFQQSNLLDMSLVDLDDHLDRIADLDGKEKEAVDIRIALTRYPELKGYRHYTNEVLLCSPELNGYCDQILIQRYGKEYIALPYTEDAGYRLYSDPVVFYLGLDNESGFGIVPFANWDAHFEEYGIDPKIVAIARDFLEQHKPVSYL